ncbi:hypothetical protein ES705_12498 [subsurface metagenome]
MWQPRLKQQEILERGWYWKESVPYGVSARWIFYKLYDFDHLYDTPKKAAYHSLFLPLFSKARKRFYGHWRPDSIVDDSRPEFLAGFGYFSEREWLEVGIGERECVIDKWQYAEYYVEIWFEAFAMKNQFEYFAPSVSLVPFKGDASIEYKWRIAKRLEEMAARYDGKPIRILYFGDADKKGEEIPENALRDIRAWCDVPFEFTPCGLTIEQARQFGLGESLDQPGSYQWESLSHEQAGELIVLSAEKFVSQGLFNKIEGREQGATDKFRKAIPEILRQLKLA